MLQRVIAILFVAAAIGFAWKAWQARDLANELALERSALSQMTDQRDEWLREATEVADQLDEAEQRYRDAEAAIQALQEELAEQAEDYDALRQRIQRSPASDDGDVAPVLRDTLERLP
ncbi:hypothetical protein LCGC14_0074720 [marine sediment metagenome]|uniref:Uncharacterized protein n=1 Tax=marine sediment metagenome TaxID=412755 RepID=A0A0F9VL60_9ZZZZ|nr:hypothetical protein [Halomonas sp.]HDZ48760.1 hypothetical protein [Halomonas sp.]HEB05533.1 hypothetical protein [Halomonas sp.]